ncbi:hypothetical protein ACEQPO_15040 [Bacillus sp. SL00103]
MVFVSHLMIPLLKDINDLSVPKDARTLLITYLRGENALFTPILINAGGNWQFTAYDSLRPSFGRLICKKRITYGWSASIRWN